MLNLLKRASLRRGFCLSKQQENPKNKDPKIFYDKYKNFHQQLINSEIGLEADEELLLGITKLQADFQALNHGNFSPEGLINLANMNILFPKSRLSIF